MWDCREHCTGELTDRFRRRVSGCGQVKVDRIRNRTDVAIVTEQGIRQFQSNRHGEFLLENLQIRDSHRFHCRADLSQSQRSIDPESTSGYRNRIGIDPVGPVLLGDERLDETVVRLGRVFHSARNLEASVRDRHRKCAQFHGPSANYDAGARRHLEILDRARAPTVEGQRINGCRTGGTERSAAGRP